MDNAIMDKAQLQARALAEYCYHARMNTQSVLSAAPQGVDAGLFDVVIVGGGMVGASLAIALQPLGLRVALVEAAPAATLPAVFDERNLSLAAASVQALQQLGVWALLQSPTGAIKQIHVSRRGEFGNVQLRAADVGRAFFGQVVIARDFGVALQQKLAQLPEITRLHGTRFVQSQLDADGVRTLQLQQDATAHTLRTRLLAAADGADSAVRHCLGIHALEEDYGQHVLVSRLRCQRAADGTAYERFTDTGPVALLPRGDGYYGLVQGVASAQLPALQGLSDADYVQQVQQVFGWRAGRFISCGVRSAYPMRRVVAAQLTAPAAVLVGNAAQSVHPVGAQGFNLGLRDALILAECIAAHGLAADAMPALLAHYAARRRQDRQRTLAFSDGLARLTANNGGIAAALRFVGMSALAHSASLREWFVGGAMGFRGDVPQLCRGQ